MKSGLNSQPNPQAIPLDKRTQKSSTIGKKKQNTEQDDEDEDVAMMDLPDEMEYSLDYNKNSGSLSNQMNGQEQRLYSN